MSDNGAPDLNSKYAWREIPPQGLPKRSASQRAADFREVYGSFNEAAAREQASRCLQCPDPSCVEGCPLCNPIPQWMALTAEGRFMEAATVLSSVTNMAEICARVCPSDQMCEGHCVLESMSKPVSIQGIEQFLIDYALAHGAVDGATAPPNGKKVVVAGSGPGGLACAEELAKKGYAVTVMDSAIVPGGVFVDGVPAFRLDQSILQRRIELLRKRGIVFRLGVGLWDVMTLGDLREDYDAVFLGFDSRQPRTLDVTGVELRGVVQAVPFLLQKSTSLSLSGPNLDISGKRVVVIGGGDTALDCLRAAIRYGAREALGIYRRELADMPCSRREYDNAVEEGVRFRFHTAPMMILGNGSDATGLRLIETHLNPSKAGERRSFHTIPDTEFEMDTDCIVLALGFDPVPCPRLEDFRKLATNSWGGLRVNESQMTNLAGVFAGGDIVRGPCLLLESVRDARKAAEAIDLYLQAR